MVKGDRVVRVSVRSNEGKIGERGTITRVHADQTGPYGYNVQWDERERDGSVRYGYVAPVRIQTVQAYEAAARTGEALI